MRKSIILLILFENSAETIDYGTMIISILYGNVGVVDKYRG